MIIYLLKSASCLALLLFFYHVILEKEKMHNFNRFYLLGSVLFSFLVPLSTITIPTTPEVIEIVQSFSETMFTENTTPIIIEESFNYTQLFIGIYLLISSIFLIRFGKNLFKIIQKIRLNETIKHEKAILVLVDDKILPHTFWKHIFINKEEYKQGKIEEELFTHELTHVTQKHTLDVLLIELLQIVFWINPLFIFLKKAIQLNHEFLADETVINQHKNTFQYQHLLLNKAAWKNEYYLASNLNYSLTKKRLKMMTTQSSHTKVMLKKLAVIPLLAGFIFLFAERVEAQEKQEIIEIVEEIPSQKIKLSETEIYKEYAHRNSFITYKDKDGKKISKRYSEMSKEEKQKLKLFTPPLKFKKNPPTKKQFEDLKDGTKVAVWINGKVVKNEVLNNYKYTDFAKYSNSFVHKNARSDRFPQKHQASLSTKKYFETQNKKRVKDFMNYLKKEYKIEEIIEKKEMNEFVLLIKKGGELILNNKTANTNNLKKLIETEIKDIRNAYVILEAAPKANLKYKLVNEIKTELRKSGIYGIGFKNFTISQKPYRIIPKKIRKVNEIEEIENPHKTLISKYNLMNKLYESKRNQKPHYVKSFNKRQKELSDLFSELGSLYFKLSKENKRKTKRPIHPHNPYLKLRKNNKVFYKLRKDLTKEDKLLIPPPPPMPNASKEEILKAKKAYKDWKKRTGNDGAPPPPKKVTKRVREIQKS